MYELFDMIKSGTSYMVGDSAPLDELKNTTNEVNNGTCEAEGCFAPATNTIEVKAGNHRTISLSLCNICVSKFVGDEGTNHKR